MYTEGNAAGSQVRIGASFYPPIRNPRILFQELLSFMENLLCYSLHHQNRPPIHREGNRFIQSVIPTPPQLLTCFFSTSHYSTSSLSPGFNQDSCSPIIPFYFFPSIFFLDPLSFFPLLMKISTSKNLRGQLRRAGLWRQMPEIKSWLCHIKCVTLAKSLDLSVLQFPHL